MKINEVIRFSLENISFTKLQSVYSYEDTLTLFETFLLKEGNLLETNSEKNIEFFKNLKNISDVPVSGKRVIVCFLNLVNDKIHRSKDIEILTFLNSKDDTLIFKDDNNNKVTYPLMYIGDALLCTFLFNNTVSYDKFRNVISLKFGTILPSVNLNEAATAGATSTGAIATVPNPHLSPGPARGKKSYTGTPGKSGTKAPPQPKPKSQKPTDNALNMKGTSIFGGPALKR